MYPKDGATLRFVENLFEEKRNCFRMKRANYILQELGMINRIK
jgi:hypothetical protein